MSSRRLAETSEWAGNANISPPIMSESPERLAGARQSESYREAKNLSSFKKRNMTFDGRAEYSESQRASLRASDTYAIAIPPMTSASPKPANQVEGKNASGFTNSLLAGHSGYKIRIENSSSRQSTYGHMRTVPNSRKGSAQ